MSKQLIQASLNLDLAKSYNPAQDAVEQIGKALDSYVKYEEEQSEKAYQIAENLQEGMVGFDLMNDQAQDYYEKELSNIATELASARARKDSKEVRRLLAKGKSLVDDQNRIGEIIYAHSQDKLSDNYVTGANTHVLDLLVNKDYRVKENKDGERIVVFGMGDNKKFDDNFLGGKEGVLLSDLDKFAIPKDTNIASDYLKTLSAVAKQSQAGKKYEGSPGQNSINVVINKIVKDVDGLQNALFTENFQLKDGKRIADLYYEEKGSQLPMNEFVSKFMTPGRKDYNAEELTDFVRKKLQDGAVNYNNFYFEEDESDKEKTATGLFYDESNNKQLIPAGREMSNGYQQKFPPTYINQQLQNLQDGKDVILGGKLFRWVDPEKTGESAWHFADGNTGNFVKVGDGTAQAMIRNEFRISGGKRINDTSKIVTEAPVIVDNQGNPVTQTSVDDSYIQVIKQNLENNNTRGIKNTVQEIFDKKGIDIKVKNLGSVAFKFTYKDGNKEKEVKYSSNPRNSNYLTIEKLIDEINRALQTTVPGSIPGEE